ncbi:MAG: hypothetical protein ABL952_04125 [Pyrinomonadaceae bacterium]
MLQVVKIIDVVLKPCALFLVTVVALLTVSAYAQGGKKTASFGGTWETVVGSATKYTVRLTQTGNKVTGSYSPRNGKIFGGLVTGNKLTFKWTQDGGYEGTGEFTLNDDGTGFTGSATSIKPTPVTRPWKTYVPAPPSSFAGTWDTKLGFRDTRLAIVQDGNKVIGRYPDQNGSIEGTVLERVLRFTWESDAGSGSGQFYISTSGESFGGWFNTGKDPDVEGTRWEGTRSSEMMGFGGKKMGSYGGTWTVDESGPKGSMELKQSGKAVTGVYRTPKGTFDLQDATVNGTILRFILVPRNPANSPRAGEVVVDGKSFKGTIDGIAVTGILKTSN